MTRNLIRRRLPVICFSYILRQKQSLLLLKLCLDRAFKVAFKLDHILDRLLRLQLGQAFFAAYSLILFIKHLMLGK